MDADGGDQAGFFRKLANLHQLRSTASHILASAIESGARFVLSGEVIRLLHRVCMNGLLDEAGNYRKTPVALSNSPYVPPNYSEVPHYMAALCDYVNNEWDHKDLVHLSSFCLWRLNWIHPFRNGNGRVSRELAYLVLCAKFGGRLPEQNTIIEQIATSLQKRTSYISALRACDDALAATNNYDLALRPMELLMGSLLKEQIRANL